MNNRRHWLELLEYVLLGGSVAGSIAAAISQQVVMAAAPLTLTLFLNTINRQQFKQSSTRNVTLVREAVRKETQALLTAKDERINNLEQQLQFLSQRLESKPDREAIAQVQQRLDRINLNDPTQKQLTELQKRTLALEKRSSVLDELGQQLTNLSQSIDESALKLDLDNVFAELSEKIEQQIDISVSNRMADINQLLVEIKQNYEYELVFDRPSSRNVLKESIAQAQERLILVCPWLGYGTDDRVISEFERLLTNGVRIEIGWGHLKDIEALGNISGSIRQQLKSKSNYYSAIPKLEKLEQKYPQQFKLKLLGTHEKFIVCDRV